MEYKQPRPIFTPEIYKIVMREIKKQKISIARLTKKHLKDFSVLVKAIKLKGLPDNLVCMKLPHKLGYGIFLHPKAKPIIKGALIGSYAGELSITQQNILDTSSYAFALIDDILLSKEEQKLFDKKANFHPKRKYSLNIDAERSGNFTRFINHSDKPNIESDVFRIPKNTYGLTTAPIEVLYTAKKTIHPGEQLLISYEGEEDSYWGVMKIKPLAITPKTFKLSKDLKIEGSLPKD